MKTVFTLGFISHIKKAPKHFIFLKFVKKLKTKGQWGFQLLIIQFQKIELDLLKPCKKEN